MTLTALFLFFVGLVAGFFLGRAYESYRATKRELAATNPPPAPPAKTPEWQVVARRMGKRGTYGSSVLITLEINSKGEYRAWEDEGDFRLPANGNFWAVKLGFEKEK